MSSQVQSGGFDAPILAALISALISAVVSFLLVWYKTYVLDPKEREAEKASIGKQLLITWIAHMKSNQQTLLKNQPLEQLVVDDRPLDQLTLTNGQLVEDMINVRSRILSFNREIEQYHLALAPQLKYLVMPTSIDRAPLAQLRSGESDIAFQLRQWRDDYLAMLKEKRMPLLAAIDKLMELLKQTIAQER